MISNTFNEYIVIILLYVLKVRIYPQDFMQFASLKEIIYVCYLFRNYRRKNTKSPNPCKSLKHDIVFIYYIFTRNLR